MRVKANVYAQIEEADKDYIGLEIVYLGLGGPVGIGLFDPAEVIGCKFMHGTERWVGSGECGCVITKLEFRVKKVEQNQVEESLLREGMIKISFSKNCLIEVCC